MTTSAAPRGLGRHLRGWQLAVVAVFIAGGGTAIVTPRAVDPSELPDPAVDGRVLAALAKAEAVQAIAAEREPLDFDVRALGTAFRAYGRADAAGDGEAGFKAREQVALAARAAIKQGEVSVLRLRAYQLRSFLREVRRWELTGVESDELVELGGGFVRLMKRGGWVDERDGRRVLCDDDVLSALFRRRFGEVTGLTQGPFAATVDEQRALLRFLLAHPAGGARDGVRADASAAAYRLKKIDEVAVLDPDYPADLARGVVLYTMGNYAGAADKLQRHLEQAPDGPWTLRARNYLRAALEKAAE